MQLLGDEPAHGSLARAHEPDEREIEDTAVAVHGDELAQFYPRRTPQIILGHSWERRRPAGDCGLKRNKLPAGRQRSQGKLKLELQRAPLLDTSAGCG